MPDLIERARSFGGDAAYPDDSSFARVPAERLVEFLHAELALGNNVDFLECLYLDGSRTEPSMELSAESNEFKSNEALLAFANEAARSAIVRAKVKHSRAYFELSVSASNA